jgi:hypothetical protein
MKFSKSEDFGKKVIIHIIFPKKMNSHKIYVIFPRNRENYINSGRKCENFSKADTFHKT